MSDRISTRELSRSRLAEQIAIAEDTIRRENIRRGARLVEHPVPDREFADSISTNYPIDWKIFEAIRQKFETVNYEDTNKKGEKPWLP